MMTMKDISRRILLVAVLWFPSCCLAFVPQSTSHSVRLGADSTALDALPTMIIGPMIKKMRENQAKKKMPMVDDSEARGQAPGLRVGGNSWKWPPIWPYDQNFFTPNEDIQIPDASSQMNPMQGLLMGGMKVPNPDEVEPVDDTNVETLDEAKYWGVEKADARTELDEEAAARLTRHYAFYLQDGMSICEFGAAEESYLPQNMKFSRHVGVSLSGKLMDKNPSLTEKLIVNLNKVIEEKGVDSDELKMLASEPFDAVIMANTVDFLTHPREVFKSAWQILKPGGIMIVPFSTRKAYSDKFERAQTKVWRDYNDDQHMWVAGSFFQFSAGDGWENLLGFDISPESAKDNLENNGPLSMFKKGKDNNIYVVQATKAFSDDTIDEENPEKSISSRMWMLPTMEERDKQLVVPRLGRAYSRTRNPLQKELIAEHIALLPTVYEALIKMDQFTFTFEMQSQLAADLVLNPDFNGNDEQMIALKQGLGLRTPSPQFWQPVGEQTGNMEISDKINLLAYLVPRFGSGDAAQEDALLAFATGLKPTFSLIRSKCPDLPESDVQLLGTELLCAEILFPGRSTKEEFAAWLGSMTEADLKDILSVRKGFNEEAKKELTEFREEQAELQRRREEVQKRYKEQIAQARKERTMAFNPASGKFEEIKKKK